jgi:hypothetical protein
MTNVNRRTCRLARQVLVGARGPSDCQGPHSSSQPETRRVSYDALPRRIGAETALDEERDSAPGTLLLRSVDHYVSAP